MNRLSPRSVCCLLAIILQLTGFSQPIHAAAKVEFFQGEKLPLAHPLANFHLIYDSQIDVVYLNTQKINITLGGDCIEATSIAREIRRSYLNGYLHERGMRYQAYLEGERAKKFHHKLIKWRNKGKNVKPKVTDPAAIYAWNERHAKSMIPANNKVAGYKVVAPEPFQKPLGIDWRKYLPHCSVLTQ